MAMFSFRSLRHRLQADPRLARMLHGGASGLLGRGVALLLSAISLPLTVHYLGKLEYGVWITISTSVVMFSVLDLGVANTLTNFISEAYAQNDREKAQRYFSTAFWVTLAVAAVLGGLFALAFHLIDWGNLLHLTDPTLIHNARLCVAISILFFLLSLPLNLANRVLGGYQEVHVSNYFAMINSIVGLAAIVVVILCHGTIVHLMLAYCSAMLTGSLALNLWIALIHKPWIRPLPRMVRPDLIRALLGQGSLFFVLQLSNLVVFNTDNLVISHYLGAAEVTPYSIAWRLTSYASMLQSILVPSFWPAFTEAYRKHELSWLRQIYWSMVRKTMLVVSVIALLIGLVGRQVIHLWVGAAAVPSPLLIWTLAGWAVLVSATTNQSILLTATGRLKLEAAVAALAALANLGLSIFFVQRIGSVGVILATILSFAVLMIIPQEREVHRILRGDFLTPTTDDLLAAASVPETIIL